VACGGFSSAQAELNIGISTITVHIQSLEQRLGYKLCMRGRSGFRLTDQGRAVYAASERLFSALEAFRLDVNNSSAVISGEIRIAMIDNLISHPESGIAEAFARFRARGPKCTLRVEVLRATEVEVQVANGSFDIGIGVFPRTPDGVITVPLFRETHRLYCGRNHPLFEHSGLGTMESSDLAEFDYVDRGVLEFNVNSAPIRFARVGARASSIEAMAILILSGSFLGYLPDHFAGSWVSSGDLRVINANSDHSAPISAIYQRKREQPNLVSAFVEDMIATSKAS
jgi:DNA-binding transcriptional LysR family regulator